MRSTLEEVDPTTSGNGKGPVRPVETSVVRPVKRRPTWVIVGVLLVIVSAAIGAWVFTSMSDRVSVVVAARTIEPGEVLEASDLAVVEMTRADDLRSVESRNQDQLLGLAARGPIPAGTLLNADLFADREQVVPAGWTVVGASLAPGAAPIAALRPGDDVTVLGVVAQTGIAQDPDAASQPTAEVLAQGTIWAVEPAGASSTNLWVSVLIPADAQGPVAQAAAGDLMRLSLTGGPP